MKKKILTLLLTPLLLLSACSSQTNTNKSQPAKTKQVAKKKKKALPKEAKLKLNKKYPGFKLTTIPTVFWGTWYRSDEFSKTARPLTITQHTIGDSVVYKKTNPNLKLDHNSETQNKTYAGGDSMITVENHNGQNWLHVREFLDTVDIIYITGTFKGQPCLYLAYSAGDIHSALFKNKKAAIKYRKYDFSKIKN